MLSEVFRLGKLQNIDKGSALFDQLFFFPNFVIAVDEKETRIRILQELEFLKNSDVFWFSNRQPEKRLCHNGILLSFFLWNFGR